MKPPLFLYIVYPGRYDYLNLPEERLSEMRPMDAGKIETMKKSAESLKTKRPDLAEPLDTFAAVLNAYEAYPPAAPEAVKSAGGGLDGPMVELSKLRIDWASAAQLFERILEILSGAEAAKEAVKEAISAAELLEAGFGAYVNRASGETRDEESPVPPNVEFAAFLTCRRILWPLLAEARAGIDAESTSYAARCPVCDSLPLLSKIEGADGIRFLVCSVCESEWPYNRTKCVSCGSTETGKFELLAADGDNETSAFLCNGCSTYIKTIDMRVAEYAFDALFYSIASAHWDYIAGSRGFATTAPWRAVDPSN